MDMSLDSLGPARPLASQGVPLGLLRGGRRRPGARARPSGGALSHGARGTALGPRRGRAAARDVARGQPVAVVASFGLLAGAVATDASGWVQFVAALVQGFAQVICDVVRVLGVHVFARRVPKNVLNLDSTPVFMARIICEA